MARQANIYAVLMYAHAVIEDPRDGTRFQRGDSVPDDLPGLDELKDAGSAREEEYDPAAEPTQTPETVEIDGVVYKRASDGATTEERRS